MKTIISEKTKERILGTLALMGIIAIAFVVVFGLIEFMWFCDSIGIPM